MYKFAILIMLFYTSTPAIYKCDTLISKNDTTVACSTFTENGSLVAVTKLLNGVFHGEFSEWYPNGTLQSVRTYNHGIPVDTSYVYYENGRIKLIGVQNGISISFFDNGDTLSVSPMHNGKPFGLCRSYFHNKNPKSFSSYNDSGKKHGLCQTWREDGTRKDSIVYDNGVIIEIREYFTSGKIRHWIKECRDADIQEALFYNPDGTSGGKVINGSGKVISYTESADRKFLDTYSDGTLVQSEELKSGKSGSSK